MSLNPLSVTLALQREDTQSKLLWATGIAFAIVLIFRIWDARAQRRGRPGTPRGMSHLSAATAYLIILHFIGPSVPVFDSFDRPRDVGDVTDPAKLFSLIQAQHTAIVSLLEIFHWILFLAFIWGTSIFFSRWPVERTDAHNWFHPGVRPDPSSEAPPSVSTTPHTPKASDGPPQ